MTPINVSFKGIPAFIPSFPAEHQGNFMWEPHGSFLWTCPQPWSKTHQSQVTKPPANLLETRKPAACPVSICLGMRASPKGLESVCTCIPEHPSIPARSFALYQVELCALVPVQFSQSNIAVVCQMYERSSATANH